MWTSKPYMAGSQGDDIVSLLDLLVLLQNPSNYQVYCQR